MHLLAGRQSSTHTVGVHCKGRVGTISMRHQRASMSKPVYGSTCQVYLASDAKGLPQGRTQCLSWQRRVQKLRHRLPCSTRGQHRLPLCSLCMGSCFCTLIHLLCGLPGCVANANNASSLCMLPMQLRNMKPSSTMACALPVLW